MVKLDPPAETKPTVVEDAGPPDPHHMSLSIGGIATFPAKDVKSFSVANQNIDVRLTPQGDTFVIAGKTKGRCDLLLIHKNGQQEIFTIEVTDH